jgi:hypothetical protein
VIEASYSRANFSENLIKWAAAVIWQLVADSYSEQYYRKLSTHCEPEYMLTWDLSCRIEPYMACVSQAHFKAVDKRLLKPGFGGANVACNEASVFKRQLNRDLGTEMMQ